MDFNHHLGIIKTIVDNVNIPVSADLESGYGEDEAMIIENVLRPADIGVAGINIEDSLKRRSGLRTVEKHCNLLANMRKALDMSGFKDFYINARTDT